MTALNFILQDDGVIISMDTLALSAGNKAPFKFVTKFFPLPHMNCIICGTGNMQAIIDWFGWVQKNIVANGIYQLNELSKKAMYDFMKDINGDNFCTIYQFGLHEIDNKFHGYAYRSKNNFQSEELEQGIGVKPTDAFKTVNGGVDLSPYMPEGASVEEILINIMERQKEYDSCLGIDERLGIGGIVQIVYLGRDSIAIKNYKYFDDFEATYDEILSNLEYLNSAE